MTENNGNILIRRIGSTTYKVRAFFKEDGTDTCLLYTSDAADD